MHVCLGSLAASRHSSSPGGWFRPEAAVRSQSVVAVFVTNTLRRRALVVILTNALVPMKTAMVHRFLTIFVFAALGVSALAEDLDLPPPMDEDPRCLARKAADEAYLKSIFDAPVAKGKPCPPNPEVIRQREIACRRDNDNARLWKFISDGFEAGSSMLSEGVPYVVEKLGEPIRVDQDDGFWDIDIFEIPRTLHFPGVTVVTRDYVSDAVNFDLTTGTVEPTNAIYEMSIESGDFRFSHGLTLQSSREDVEAALGLPCGAVAHSGRTAVRKQVKYSYTDTSEEERSRYSVTFKFYGASRIESIRWYYQSAWH